MPLISESLGMYVIAAGRDQMAKNLAMVKAMTRHRPMKISRLLAVQRVKLKLRVLREDSEEGSQLVKVRITRYVL